MKIGLLKTKIKKVFYEMSLENQIKKQIIFSGIQATGQLTLGNYIGAIKNWTNLQHEYKCYFAVVDLHSITVRQDPIPFRERCLDFLIQYIACGIDPEVSTMFFQSHVRTHAELAWVLNCYTYMGELSRMTQFKDKSAQHVDNINAGLLTYPALMAADILLYQADLVPVGNDQKQHIELTRDVAIRFNGLYGDTFKIPAPFFGKVGARIMSLLEPQNKMSKTSPNPNTYIALLDAPDVIVKKLKRAVTDSENLIKYDQTRPGISNLIDIYSACTGLEYEQIEKEFDGKGYGSFKLAVAEAVIETLKPINQKFNELKSNPDYVEKIYREGAEKALKVSSKTLNDVYYKIGFVK